MKKYMIILLLSSVILTSCKSIKNVQYDQSQDQYSCIFGDTTRKFILCLPPAPDSNTKLILMFHGYGSNGYFFKNQTHLEREALAKNYAVVYITGIPRKDRPNYSSGWNYNYDRYGREEVQFVEALIKYLQKEYGLGKQVYAVGFSNGAFFVNKLATQKPELLTAAVSVGGMMPDLVWNHLPKNTSTRFMQINGTKDDVVPMRLNNSAKNNPHPAMEDVIKFYADGKASDYKETESKIEKISDKTTLTRYGSKAWWVLIQDYTHNWPKEDYCGFNINTLILKFFG